MVHADVTVFGLWASVIKGQTLTGAVFHYVYINHWNNHRLEYDMLIPYVFILHHSSSAPSEAEGFWVFIL